MNAIDIEWMESSRDPNSCNNNALGNYYKNTNNIHFKYFDPNKYYNEYYTSKFKIKVTFY